MSIGLIVLIVLLIAGYFYLKDKPFLKNALGLEFFRNIRKNEPFKTIMDVSDLPIFNNTKYKPTDVSLIPDELDDQLSALSQSIFNTENEIKNATRGLPTGDDYPTELVVKLANLNNKLTDMKYQLNLKIEQGIIAGKNLKKIKENRDKKLKKLNEELAKSIKSARNNIEKNNAKINEFEKQKNIVEVAQDVENVGLINKNITHDDLNSSSAKKLKEKLKKLNTLDTKLGRNIYQLADQNIKLAESINELNMQAAANRENINNIYKREVFIQLDSALKNPKLAAANYVYFVLRPKLYNLVRSDYFIKKTAEFCDSAKTKVKKNKCDQLINLIAAAKEEKQMPMWAYILLLSRVAYKNNNVDEKKTLDNFDKINLF